MRTVTWTGRLGPLELTVGEKVFEPSTTSKVVADAMRVEPGEVVVDVGCGTGILAIIAARLGAGRVFAVDITPECVEVGTANAARHGVADRITFLHGDLFDPLPPDLRADLVIGDVSGIPDTLAEASGWFPPGAGGGGPRGVELPLRMLEEAMRVLKPAGRLLLPTGTIQDEPALLQCARALFREIRQLADRSIPLPTKLAESDNVSRLIDEGVVKLRQRGSRWLWTVRVWECLA